MVGLLSYLCIAVLVTFGCSMGNISLTQNMHPVYVDELDVNPPGLMVSETVETPLVLVLDPDSISDRKRVTNQAMKPIDVHNIHSFVAEHLRPALTDYFDTVEVVGPDESIDHENYIVGHVRLDTLDVFVDSATDGYQTATRFLGKLTWSFALEPSGTESFLFSYAGTTRGTYAPGHVSETSQMYASTFTAALAEMLESYIEKEVQQELLAWEGSRRDESAPVGGLVGRGGLDDSEETGEDEAVDPSADHQAKLLGALVEPWDVPEGIDDDELRDFAGETEILVSINDAGEIEDWMFVRRSGSDEFNESIRRLLGRFEADGGTETLPLPDDDETRSEIVDQGILLSDWRILDSP